MNSLTKIFSAVVLALAVTGCVVPNVAGRQSNPFGETGFRVLIVEETSQRDRLSAEQGVMLFSTAAGSVRDYCESHCAKRDGASEFLILDMTDASGTRRQLALLPPCWSKAVAAAEGKALQPPYMVASNGKKSYIGPLPKDTAAALAILKPMGGKERRAIAPAHFEPSEPKLVPYVEGN